MDNETVNDVKRVDAIDTLSSAGSQLGRRSPTIGKIALALSRAQGMAINLEKAQETNGLRFQFVAIGQVTQVARDVFKAHELAFFFDTVSADIKPHPSKDRAGKGWVRCRMEVDVTLAHSSGEWMTTRYIAEGDDNADKVLNKAATMAMKQALQKLLLISSRTDAEDPDWYQDEETPEEKKAREEREAADAAERIMREKAAKEEAKKAAAAKALSAKLGGTGEAGKQFVETLKSEFAASSLKDVDIAELQRWTKQLGDESTRVELMNEFVVEVLDRNRGVADAEGTHTNEEE